jgi:hypothetical protein
MDEGCMPNFDDAIDKKYSLNSSDRQVMAGISDANSHENLLTWTMRHEIGHSVDKKIHWEENNSKEEIFGGWQKETKESVFEKMMNTEVIPDISNFQLNNKPFKKVPQDYLGNWDLIEMSRQKKLIKISKEGVEVPEENYFKLTKLYRSFEIAKNSPWTFADGAEKDTCYADRIYMFSQYDEWQSYKKAARDNAVSNYQFSDVKEWFAEAYAAYYNPDPNAASRNRLSPVQKVWFEKTLGKFKTK